VYPNIVYGEVADSDEYGNSYLDYQFWSGRCYEEDLDLDGFAVEDISPIPEIWVPEDVYNDYDYLKLDSYHRFELYPNILS